MRSKHHSEIENHNDIIDMLLHIGLRKEEAKAYVAILTLGVANATEIAKIARIPRSHIYEVLNSLFERGLIRLISGSPKRYAITDPNISLKPLIKRIKMTLDAAYDKIYRLANSNEVPNKGIMILTDSNLLSYLKDELSHAESVKIADNIGLIKLLNINELFNRKVQIKIVTGLDESAFNTSLNYNDEIEIRYSYLILPLSLVIIEDKVIYLIHDYNHYLLGIRMVGDIAPYLQYFEHVWSDHYAKILRRARARRITEIY